MSGTDPNTVHMADFLIKQSKSAKRYVARNFILNMEISSHLF